MVKGHIWCGGDADGVATLTDGDVIAWIEVNRFSCGDLLGFRTIIARQCPAFLQLGDAGAVLVNCRAMLCQGIAVLVHHIAQVGHVGVGGILICPQVDGHLLNIK